jgi:hypothetical protein
MRVVKELTTAMDDRTAEVRMEAVVSIIGLGKPASPADVSRLDEWLRTRLKKEVKEGDKLVVIWMHMALMKINDVQEAELKAVAKFLKDKDAAVREQAASALGMLGKDARPVISDLLETLQDKVPEVVLAAGTALVNSGSRSERILEALKEVRERKDSPETLKKAVTQLLDKMQDKAEK